MFPNWNWQCNHALVIHLPNVHSLPHLGALINSMDIQPQRVNIKFDASKSKEESNYDFSQDLPADADQGLQTIRSIHIVSSQEEPMGSDGAKLLAGMKMPTLTRLILQSNHLGSEGAIAIAQADFTKHLIELEGTSRRN